MRIVSIEPTPSPNSMKINVDVRLPDGVRHVYTAADAEQAPQPFAALLAIPGVTELFHTADFVAVEREPKADWQSLLSAVREALGSAKAAEPPVGAADAGRPLDGANASAPPDATAPGMDAEPAGSFGEAHVFVQTFRGIPLQIRVRSDEQEERTAMPQPFIDAAMKAQYGSPNLIAERVLEDRGVRYGDRKEIAEQIRQELEASYDAARLEQLVQAALAQEERPASPVPGHAELVAALQNDDWRVRYAALDKLKPEPRTLPLILQALDDGNFSIRRLATVYLGDIREPEVLPYLYRMLRDQSASVRRTAGDCLSDIGDPDAIGPMCEALRDPSKIVRWRAARFLYEAGDESALAALHAAKDDAEFEIRMQIQYAVARIEGGEAAAGSVWQQMTRRNDS